MDKKLKAKWLKALRSGKYKQCEGKLFDGKGYCCLGVLAEIQGCDIDETFPNLDQRITEHLPRGFNAGLKRRQRTSLAARNDGVYDPVTKDVHSQHSFKEIADYIEKHL